MRLGLQFLQDQGEKSTAAARKRDKKRGRRSGPCAVRDNNTTVRRDTSGRPGAVATHETHWPIDQHGLLQARFDEFANPALTPAQAMGNMPKAELKKELEAYL